MDKPVFKIIKKVASINALVALFGNFDENVKLLEREFGVSVSVHGSELSVSGESEENTEKCSSVIDLMLKLISNLVDFSTPGDMNLMK